MELILAYTSTIMMICITFGSQAQTDPVKKANAANEQKADEKVLDEDVADFLVKSADARMMDFKEGKLATEKGTTQTIKDYGKLMVKDQALLLDAIKKLAATRHISLPSGISDKKEEGRDELSEKSGEDFDKKFIKMMIIDHERDIKLFKKAIDYKDKDVSDFAKKYLPMIQIHLDKIEVIKAASK